MTRSPRTRSMQVDLDWPRETASEPATSGVLIATGSNIVLDVHGDPVAARLAVLSDGNHHMALADAMKSFVARHPEVGDVFYLTTPPRILLEVLGTRRLRLGNLMLPIDPDVIISPRPILDRLHEENRIGAPTTFASSRGTAILVAKGNPLGIRGIADLLRADVRLALSNPVTEAASFAVYAAALAGGSLREDCGQADVAALLSSDAVLKSRVIHHREIPQLIAAGDADASLVYQHLALRYVRIFPDQFEIVATTDEPVTHYAIATIEPCRDLARPFVEYFQGPQVARHYASHGLTPVTAG